MALSSAAVIAISGLIESVIRVALEFRATEEEMQERFGQHWENFKTKYPEHVKNVLSQVYPEEDSG